ncbi:MAG: Crp/Fnr family transcriptional regulator [Cyclobacteriaceae bacterium]|nr:Crp/Fnr family transcriptional regulator [Cyclobacteriaceae bacterium]
MSNTSSLWYLEKVDLYEILCPHKVPKMAEKHTFHHFSKEQYIYFPNQPSQTIYMISEGRVKIGSYTPDGKEIVKAILGHGELFGELALAGEGTRTDFALAMDTPTTVCPMMLEDMQELMAENKALSLKILKIIGFRLRRSERKIESLVFKDARTRIIEFLKETAEEKGEKVGFETMIRNHLTHKDIASLTGTSRQTVTTLLNELRDKNIISFDRRRILIRDIHLLA